MKKQINTLDILDLFTVSFCAVILSILFSGIILVIGAVVLGAMAYRNYKQFLQDTEQITVEETPLIQDVIILKATVKTKSKSIIAKHIASLQAKEEVNFLPLQLGLFYGESMEEDKNYTSSRWEEIRNIYLSNYAA